MKVNNICVAGAGTMGSGIALCAAQNGFEVILFDLNSQVMEKAIGGIKKNLTILLEKNKITAEEKELIFNRIKFTSDIHDCKASLIIEAIIEKMAVKTELFNQLASINSAETIFASNTSSLSIDELQRNVPNPERVAGMHFFNPAQIMKLVEVVKAVKTSEQTISVLVELCKQLQKTPVVCKDAPGFIVNRVARHYYLEAMRLVEKGIADIESVDALMEASGFKMGPFKLMDLIGNDINLAVSQSLYEAFKQEPRFQPSELQIEKVRKGDLGKKTGKGFYDYQS
jgi:3-hydroxybutyryl-CoA dehydrogenase